MKNSENVENDGVKRKTHYYVSYQSNQSLDGFIGYYSYNRIFLSLNHYFLLITDFGGPGPGFQAP